MQSLRSIMTKLYIVNFIYLYVEKQRYRRTLHDLSQFEPKTNLDSEKK